LGGCGHEANQRVPDGLLRGVLGGAVEGEVVITVRITTPRRMNSRIVSHTSS
jgi:hypothetical protein